MHFRYNNTTMLLWILWMTIPQLTPGAPIMEQNAPERLPMLMNPGVNFRPIPGIRIYEDDVALAFPIPDIPEYTIPTKFDCKSFSTTPWCWEVLDNMLINHESFNLINTTIQLFTEQGINSAEIKINPSRNLTPIRKEILPTASKAGLEWFANTRSILEQRKMQLKGASSLPERRIRAANETLSGNSIKKPRSAGSVFGKVASFAGKYILPLFVNDGVILEGLSQVRSSISKIFTPFTDMPRSSSQLAVQEKVALAETSVAVNRLEENLQSPNHNYGHMASALLAEQHGILIQSTITMVVHFSALQDCRNGQIPLAFVPPMVLTPRVDELENSIADHLQLVIPSSEIHLYYHEDAASCSMDSSGGVVYVKAYTVAKGSMYKLYELQPMGFGWHDQFCDLGLTSGYIVRDENSGDIFPVSELDENTCSGSNSFLCRLPKNTNADLPNQYCLMSLLNKGTASEIRAACPLICRPGRRITSTQIDQDHLLVAHLPKSGATVQCYTSAPQEITHNIDVGALRIKLGCGCTLQVKHKLIGKSHRTECPGPTDTYTITHIIPNQMGTLDSWIPDIDKSFQDLQFIDPREAINPRWKPTSLSATDDPSSLNLRSTIMSLCMSLVNWSGIMYFLFRYRLGPFAFLAGIHVANALVVEECSPTEDVYILLYAILGMLTLNMLHKYGSLACDCCKSTIERAINRRAVQQLEMLDV